ncbi:LCP family protein [Myceligenerans crystallogenes]|uniref:LCP family protein n=1 Tax=Myceligenerans crystallogenes TaxID=316335 RepID=A0ABN2N6B7_9MICO
MPLPERPSAQHASLPPHPVPKRADRPANRHSSGKGWSRKPRIVAMAAVGVLALGGASAFAVVQELMGEVEVSDVSGIIGATPVAQGPGDPFADSPVNILVMGTDHRDAANAAIAGAGDETGMRSDTTMLVHISADRSWIHVVSIPRDSMVYRPSCKLPGGGMSQGFEIGQFNGSFDAAGSLTGEGPDDLTYGAACTIQTVMENTGIPLPNHVVVKMNGVIDVVDAMDGVRVCLPYPIVTPANYGGVNLPAGEQRLDGMDAIDYLRARHVEGTSQSDLERIDRQQGFINAMLRQLLSAETLANPATMLNLSKAVLGSVSPDPALGDARHLAGLALSLKDIQQNRIKFTTIPNQPWTQDPNRVEWTPDADQVWADITNDVPPAGLPPLPGEKKEGAASKKTAGAQEASAEVEVDGGAAGTEGGAEADPAGEATPDATAGDTAKPSASSSPEPSQPTGTCAG